MTSTNKAEIYAQWSEVLRKMDYLMLSAINAVKSTRAVPIHLPSFPTVQDFNVVVIRHEYIATQFEQVFAERECEVMFELDRLSDEFARLAELYPFPNKNINNML